MKFTGKLAALGLAIAMTASLAACGGGVTKNDATTYVKGYLDATYKGIYNEDYLKLMDKTEEEAAKLYQENLEYEAEYFMSPDVANIYITDASKAKVVELYKQIYALCKYEVQPANKLQDGSYMVEVQVEPLDVIATFLEDFDATEVFTVVCEENGVTSNEQLSAMSDAEYEELDGKYCDRVIEMVTALLPNAGYETEQSASIRLKLNGDVYEPVGTDFGNLDGMLIDYFGYYA